MWWVFLSFVVLLWDCGDCCFFCWWVCLERSGVCVKVCGVLGFLVWLSILISVLFFVSIVGLSVVCGYFFFCELVSLVFLRSCVCVCVCWDWCCFFLWLILWLIVCLFLFFFLFYLFLFVEVVMRGCSLYYSLCRGYDSFLCRGYDSFLWRSYGGRRCSFSFFFWGGCGGYGREFEFFISFFVCNILCDCM